MNRKNKNILTIILILLSTSIMFGQTRSTINDGVDKYQKGDFVGATENFTKSIDEKFENYRGHFNLGDALYKQEKYEDALSSYKNAMALAQTDNQKAEVFHNVGNSLLKSDKLEDAIGAYSESLKLNPNDLETKYNLSYALKKMQQQQNEDKNKDKNDENKDDKKDDQNKDQKKNDDKKDQNKDDKQDQQNQDNKDDKKDEQQQQNQQQQPPPEISKEEAQRILDALKDDEAEMQKELRKKKGKKVKVEKDW